MDPSIAKTTPSMHKNEISAGLGGDPRFAEVFIPPQNSPVRSAHAQCPQNVGCFWREVGMENLGVCGLELPGKGYGWLARTPNFTLHYFVGGVLTQGCCCFWLLFNLESSQAIGISKMDSFASVPSVVYSPAILYFLAPEPRVGWFWMQLVPHGSYAAGMSPQKAL